MGAFPRVVYWDEDERKDLLVGRSDGLVMIFSNVGTDADPHFDGGTRLQVGSPGFKSDIDVGSRATPTAVDWDGDGRKDLVVGAIDGRLHLFLNEGTDTDPDFRTEQFVQEDGADLVVPAIRSSPDAVDLTHDGKKDILTGNTEGQLLLYENTGSDQAPSFSGYVPVETDGVPIDLLSSARSRPFVCNWTDDGVPDVLIGSADGLVRMYRGSDVATGTRPANAFPPATTTRLLAAYPNPFRQSTTVPFVLGSNERVRVLVYDLAGRRVATLTDRLLAEGTREISWDGRNDEGRRAPAGTYFVRMEAGGTVASEKLIRLR
jgi:hypothetical protein